MKLKKFIPLVNFLQEIEIRTSDQEKGEDPFYSGTVFDMPWIFLNMEIGRIDDPEEPIYTYVNDKGHSVMVINLIEKEYQNDSKK